MLFHPKDRFLKCEMANCLQGESALNIMYIDVTVPDGERHAPLQLRVRRRPVLLLVVIVARLHQHTSLAGVRGGAANEISRHFPNIRDISLSAAVVSSHAVTGRRVHAL